MTDKKTLKQNYLEAGSRAGVYIVRNLANKRALVAGSKDVQGALNRHCFELRTGMHRNRLLQQDWKEHGEANFEFTVLDRIKPTNDPGFDAERELQVLVALWRQEIPCQGGHGYGDAKAVLPTPTCPSPTPQ